jgi:hypothetical protein
MKKQKGDLIYVPSSTVLMNGSSPTDIRKLKEPGVYLVVSDTDSSYNILYEGSQWLVSKRHAYKVQEDIRL